MIVVGIGQSKHDGSICAYINGEIKYRKAERAHGKKHCFAPDYFMYETLREWGVSGGDVDLFIQTDSGIFDTGAKTLPYDGEMILSKGTNHLVVDHHMAHVWSDLSYMGADQAVVVDGRGSGHHTGLVISATRPAFRINQFSIGKTMRILMGFTNNSDDQVGPDAAGKLMGLMSYGTSDPAFYAQYKDVNPAEWIHNLNMMPPEQRGPEVESWLNILATCNDLLYSLLYSNYFERTDKSKKIIYSGGCALNIDWNRRVQDAGYQLSVMPYVYDGGLSIGLVRWGMSLLGEEPFTTMPDFPYCQDDEAPESLPSTKTIKKVAEELAKGKIVGWYQGHGELGPRALGNRSILMRPDLVDGKDVINQKVKHREWWRPFGASVKQDQASKYFDINDSPYMLLTSKVLSSDLHSITHVDGTCRHQTVTPQQNVAYYELLDEFEKLTGISVLLNTSLNLGGKPIAGTIKEAKELYATSGMDALCIGDHLK